MIPKAHRTISPKNKTRFVFPAILLLLMAAAVMVFGGQRGHLFGAGIIAGTGAFIVLAAVSAIYLAPTLVAFEREHSNRVAIFATNILLGWTFLGWAIALIWALTQPKHFGKPRYWGKP